MRQQRERAQFWGPEQLAAEFVTSMKEAWRPCVEEQLWKHMFSQKMEEQLNALQQWMYQVQADIDSIDEVMDMVLKWLTWLLFNANTQVWKMTLEVLRTLLDSLASRGDQLTDREAQILIPIIAEKSGHNLVAFRESLVAVLLQTRLLYPHMKMMPLLLHGLSSKNKRSAACVLRTISELLDGHVAASLARNQKDVSCILKLLEDKDAELRKSAVHLVASLSQHLAADAFARICKTLTASARQAVSSAASKLPSVAPPPAPRTETASMAKKSSRASCPSEIQASAAVAVTPRGDALPSRSSTAAAPSTHHVLQQAPPVASPPRETRSPPAAECAEWAAPSRLSSPAPMPKLAEEAPNRVSLAPQMPLGHMVEQAPVGQLAKDLERCRADGFEKLCVALVVRMKQVTEEDAPALAEALTSVMPRCFSPEGCATFCQPIISVLDEFCASRECIRPLPAELLQRLLGELLAKLSSTSWSKRLQEGTSLLRKLNLSCVMLLSNMTRASAYVLLLELGTRESEAVGSLPTKCLRKLNKSLWNSKSSVQEMHAVMDGVDGWCRRSWPLTGTAVAFGEAVRDMLEAAQVACPPALDSWAPPPGGGEEGERRPGLLRFWPAPATNSAEGVSGGLPGSEGKENTPTAASLAAPTSAASTPVKGEASPGAEALKGRSSLPLSTRPLRSPRTSQP